MSDNRMGEVFAQDRMSEPPPRLVPEWLDMMRYVGEQANPERFIDASTRMPLSVNIEDRRGENYPRRWAVRPQYRAAGD
jgi:hypothetical protein